MILLSSLLKNDPRIFFFLEIEIFTIKIVNSKGLKKICRQLLSTMNVLKTFGEGPRLVPPKREFPLLIVPTPEGWKAEYTLASRMQIYESLTVLALLTSGEARTGDP